MANRGYAYQKQRKAYLKRYEQHGGWWICEVCKIWTQSPELDHIENTGMGGSALRLMDENNYSIKCHDCHQAKTENRTLERR